RDLLHQLDAARMRFTCRFVHKQRDRHTPGALARDAPIRATFDHAVDAFLAPGRIPVDVVADRLECARAQSFLIHADEPLRRRTEDHRRAVAPAMRIAVCDLLAREQYAALAQDVDDRIVRLPHELAADEFGIRQIDAVAADGIDDAEAVFLADLEILDAVRGR